MGKRYLRSDCSIEEARFFTTGQAFIGTGNILTGLIKYIGKYDKLEKCGRTFEILTYKPDEDRFFINENWGYTILSNEIAKTKIRISRKYIKALSRKWPASAVLISFDAIHIISELFAYISNKKELYTVCNAYLKSYDIPNEWNKICPIQYDFLGERNQDHHKNWQIAENIINDLTTIMLEETK